MDDFDDFEVVFGSNPNVAYDEETRRKIHHNRHLLENELFIDRLLKALGVANVPKVYPPGSTHDLKNLHYQISSSQLPDHQKHAVFYYLLRDISHSSRRSPEKFAATSYLPDRYKMFINGVWYLDRLKFERALDYLTEPALIPTFAEEILYTLCCHCPENDVTLPVAYYQSVSPTITSSKVLGAYFLIVCRASVTEAFYYSRTQGDVNHRVLFEKLLMFVHAKSNGAIKATRGVELISLPLTEEEEGWFMTYLVNGKGSRLSGAADTVTMREIATGRSKSTQHRSRNSNEKIDGISWNTLKAVPEKR